MGDQRRVTLRTWRFGPQGSCVDHAALLGDRLGQVRPHVAGDHGPWPTRSDGGTETTRLAEFDQEGLRHGR